MFALKAGLVGVVQAALIGSILANLLLVLGLAFLVGGLKHGAQQLNSERARSIIVLMVLSVAAMVVPSLAHYVHTPAAAHEKTLSLIVSVVLLVLFALTLPASCARSPAARRGREPEPRLGRGRRRARPRAGRWLAVGLLALAAAAPPSSPTGSSWRSSRRWARSTSPSFAGLVIVAIAGNAIENVVGVQLAAQNRSEYAFRS